MGNHVSVAKGAEMCVCIYVQSPYLGGGFVHRGGLCKAPIWRGLCIYRGGFVKSLGASYTNTYKHMHILVFFPTDMWSTSQSPSMKPLVASGGACKALGASCSR